jgi:predicted kinase
VPLSHAALFLLAGLPGAGKSTFARALAQETGALVVESDRLRRLLFGQPVFSGRESEALFRALNSATRRLLEEGYAVIVDATNLSESDRRPFYELADALGFVLAVVALDAPVPVVERRLEERLARSCGYSYADVAVYHRMRERVEPISRAHRRIDTSDRAGMQAALAEITAAYRAKGEIGK